MTGITKTTATLLCLTIMLLVSVVGKEDGTLSKIATADKRAGEAATVTQNGEQLADIAADNAEWNDQTVAGPDAEAPLPHVATVSEEAPVIEDYKPEPRAAAPVSESQARYATPPPNGRDSNDMPEGTVIRNFDPRVS